MSFQAMTLVVDEYMENPTAKLLLLVLANYANHEWECWPSQQLLADQVGISTRSVRNNLKWLEEQNLIARTPRYTGEGRKSDVFKIQRENFAAWFQQPEKYDTPKRKQASREPIIEPSSVTNVTGADAPLVSDQVWKVVAEIAETVAPSEAKQLRSVVGKALGRNPHEVVLTSIRMAAEHGALEPVSYFLACVNSRMKPHPRAAQDSPFPTGQKTTCDHPSCQARWQQQHPSKPWIKFCAEHKDWAMGKEAAHG